MISYKTISGYSVLVLNEEVNISIAARAPKYEPQFQSLQASEFDLIRLDASTILENSSLS